LLKPSAKLRPLNNVDCDALRAISVPSLLTEKDAAALLAIAAQAGAVLEEARQHMADLTKRSCVCSRFQLGTHSLLSTHKAAAKRAAPELDQLLVKSSDEISAEMVRCQGIGSLAEAVWTASCNRLSSDDMIRRQLGPSRQAVANASSMSTVDDMLSQSVNPYLQAITFPKLEHNYEDLARNRDFVFVRHLVDVYLRQRLDNRSLHLQVGEGHSDRATASLLQCPIPHNSYVTSYNFDLSATFSTHAKDLDLDNTVAHRALRVGDHRACARWGTSHTSGQTASSATTNTFSRVRQLLLRLMF